jgi:ankyrin repeat protein/L-ascorbate metabolism protein UlaG (beta-lactamase superfamily)
MTPRTIVLAAALILAGLPAAAGQIHDAAAAGDKAKVAALLAADRTAVNAPGDDQFKSRPLHVAAEKGRLEIARLLLDAGATVDGFDSDQSTPLDVAAKEGHQEVVALLLERGADVNRRDRNGACAMSFAMGRTQTAVVRQLLAAGADVNYMGRGGHTLLEMASRADSLELVKLLIEQGADVNVTAWNGDSPLMLAVRQAPTQATPIVEALLAAGASTAHTQAGTRRTALHFAVLSGAGDVVTRLLGTDADINAEDAEGLTPLDLATRYCHPAIAATLASRGAKALAVGDTGGVDLRSKVAPGEAVVWYLGHSGWAVKTGSRLLIFDSWQRGASGEDAALCNGRIRPEELAGQKVVVFASHEHSDHLDPAIFTWRDKVPGIAYVLGATVKDAPPHTRVEGRQTIDVGGMKVTTFPASDAGVGFLVEVDGVRILHAGDHANSKRDLSGPFMPEIDYLASLGGPAPDLAFLPISGCRFGDQVAVQVGVQKALATLKPKVFFPMHGGGNEQVYRELIAKVSGSLPGTQMVAASLPGDHVMVRKGRVVAASTGGTAPVTLAGAACAVPRGPAGCAGQ